MKDIDEWMTINKLKLNKSRTELIVIGSQHRPKTEIEVLTLGSNDASCDVYSSNAARNIFDESLGLKLVNGSHLQDVIFSHSTNCSYSKIFV